MNAGFCNMSSSHIKIKAARVGNATEVLVNGEKPPGLLGVQFDSNVGNATMVTLKMFAAVEVGRSNTGID
jgi:hypothetical protein